MKLRVGLLTVAVLLASGASSEYDWRTPYAQMSPEERDAFHDDYDADGDYVISRYTWIQWAEDARPVLQRDEDLWQQALIDCELCAKFDQEERMAQLRAYRDEDNAVIDEEISRLLHDDSGEFRRELAKRNQERFERTRAQVHLDRQRMNAEKARKLISAE